ncbi:lipopolysaccharide transport periplasmic protein LptA [Jeongeupia naejangsanensis]|uniref:Lipopolysaccharide export system protein LptA n=1 Tax=Jeongeupia naejangsanensis TaxID=613195 RepID=A0ABS2BK44_9NEIS|nr:lipopolysaccharide transport periplasmic protein LptA [Jeongeupia naejangsanensis]MBM3115979.1 lipopolysaccharide transport periplasmic protein LptA [Jeongeupia naejangsanensis]
MSRRRRAAELSALILLAAPMAHAENADREKPMNIEADHANFDQKNNVGVYTGNVIVVQGTMTLKADKVTVRQDADGNQFSQGDGKPVKFRQRMDTGEWVDANSLHYDYDGKTGILKLINKAWVRRDTGDEVIGDVIVYDMATSTYQAQTDGKPGSRVNITLMPKKKDASATAAKPAKAVASKPAASKPAAASAPKSGGSWSKDAQ